MQRILLILLAMPMFLPSWSRDIKGVVLSDADSTAIIGAECLVKVGDKMIQGASTGADGSFEISTAEKGAMALEVSMTGYAPTEIVIESGAGNINVGRIYLNEAEALGEVTVTGKHMIDARGRTLVYPSASDIKASSTSVSLFSKLPLPGLLADPINRTLSVDGGSPIILIDGVPASMDDVNALAPKNIERIEYSRITPARYADRGSSGFINITLKKRDDGGDVYLWGRSAVSTAFVDANLRASYHQGPSQFTVSYSPSWRNYKKVYDDKHQSFVGADFRVNLDEHDRNPFNYLGNPMRLKYLYRPTSRTIFSATLMTSVMTNKREYMGTTIDSFLGEYSNHNISDGKGVTPSLDLYLNHDFNDRNSLELQMVGTLGYDDYHRTNLYDLPEGDPQAYVMDVDSRRRSLISEVSYTHTFSDRTSLSGGYQNTVSHSKNLYKTTDREPVLTENNNYVYVSLGQQIRRVYLSLSTGAKLFWISNDDNKRHFIRNLTTVQGSWNISDSWNLGGTFLYSPSIPTLSSLTDYPQQVSPYLISNGSPGLKVAENFIWQLMPSFRKGKFSSSLFLSWNECRNAVIQDMFYLGDKLFLSQSVNSRKQRAYGASLNMRLSDIAGFGANVTFTLSRYESGGEGWDNHLTSFSGSMSVWWNKGPWTVSYWRKLPGKYLSGHIVGKEENGDALSLEFRPDKHWNIGVDWMYMFDRKGTRYPTWNYSAVNPATNDRYIKHNGNMVVLSVQYVADFGSVFRSKRRSLNNSDSGSSLLKM